MVIKLAVSGPARSRHDAYLSSSSAISLPAASEWPETNCRCLVGLYISLVRNGLCQSWQGNVLNIVTWCNVGTWRCSVRSPQWLRGKWWSMKRHIRGYQDMTFQGLLPVTDYSVCIINNYQSFRKLIEHCIFMVALCNRADHYIFALWFLSFFLLFFSSPNLSGRRLDVYHTSTHGVALVRI